MSNTYNYTFDNMSRIGLDSCCIDQDTIQNVQACNYTLQNYFANDCSMKTPIALATSQPGVFYNGGMLAGAGGCNIDESSKLQIGSIQTHPRCHIDLFQRPFATVPLFCAAWHTPYRIYFAFQHILLACPGVFPVTLLAYRIVYEPHLHLYLMQRLS